MSPTVVGLLVLAALSEGCAFRSKPVLVPVIEPPSESLPCWEWLYTPHGREMLCTVAD